MGSGKPKIYPDGHDLTIESGITYNSG